MPDWTPGPWEVFRSGPGLEVKTVYGRLGMDRSQLIPAVVMPGVNAEANARLIAAAPDMWAALVDLIDFLENEGIRDALEWLTAEEDARLAMILGRARAAVAQARGETTC
jgi:hypothetical protein